MSKILKWEHSEAVRGWVLIEDEKFEAFARSLQIDGTFLVFYDNSEYFNTIKGFANEFKVIEISYEDEK